MKTRGVTNAREARAISGLLRPAIVIALLLLVYLSSLGIGLARYKQVPSLKKDLRIRQEIIARFPKDFEVTVRTADLLGLGDRFYVAGGNSSYILHAYSIGNEPDKDTEALKGRVNYPILKMFYIKEPGFLSALFSVIPFFDVEKQFAQMSIRQYFEFTPIPTSLPSGTTFSKIRNEYSERYGFPATFSLLDFQVFDPDSDGQEEVVTQWLSYGGGSGGTKWSAIIDFVNGELKISSGYPDFLNVGFSKTLWAVLLYSGLLGDTGKDSEELFKLLPILREMGLTDSEAKILLSPRITNPQVNPILNHLHSLNQNNPDRFVNVFDGRSLELFGRHTDDYSKFIRIDGNYLFAEAFYIADSNCHWCGHYWRLMSFLYRDGRWISDRVVNGDAFGGTWLSVKRKYDLNEVFGTYPDQGLFGIAFSFLNPHWTQSSKEGISDPIGIEMRLTSPIEKRIQKLHQQEGTEH
jgi:hypothetical protein